MTGARSLFLPFLLPWPPSLFQILSSHSDHLRGVHLALLHLLLLLPPLFLSFRLFFLLGLVHFKLCPHALQRPLHSLPPPSLSLWDPHHPFTQQRFFSSFGDKIFEQRRGLEARYIYTPASFLPSLPLSLPLSKIGLFSCTPLDIKHICHSLSNQPISLSLHVHTMFTKKSKISAFAMAAWISSRCNLGEGGKEERRQD